MEFASPEVLVFVGLVLVSIGLACWMACLNRNESVAEIQTDSVELTHRGFQIITFRGAYGIKCSLQQSSAIGVVDSDAAPGSSYVWLGIDSPKPRVMKSVAAAKGMDVGPGEVTGWMDYPLVPEVFLSGRMHLDKERAAMLVKYLSHWIDTGRLESP